MPSWELFKHKYLHRPYRLHSHDHGGDGPVLVLLHGIAASSAKWSALLPILQPHFHCITIDLIGFGDSPKPQWYGYTMDDHLRCIDYTIRKLKLKQPFVVAGHSLGSLLASRYARLSPKAVSRLLLFSPPVYAPLDSITSRTARARNRLLIEIYQFLRSHKRTPENLRRLSYLLPIPKSIFRDPQTLVPFMKSLEHCIETQTISEDLLYVKCPVEIFYGGLDSVVVSYNVRALANLRNVNVHRINAVNHEIGKRYATAAAKYILQG